MLFNSEPEERTLRDEIDEFCTCSYETRIKGFGICFVLGWFITFMSTIAIVSIVTNPAKFAVLYTFGNLISLASTCFLFGPCSQIKSMLKHKRIFATILYFSAMIMTLVLAFKVRKALPVLLSMLLQFIAMIWYSLSYIPYARTLVTNLIF